MKNLLLNIGEFSNKLKYLIYLLAVFSLLAIPNEAYSQLTYSISKSNNAPNPIKSGQPFTYTITYNWSGGAPGTLYIQDNIPASLEVLSALPSSPISTITGNFVEFEITGLTNPSGSGTVQINARFKPGVTCGGVEACNVAEINRVKDGGTWIKSNSSCVISDEPVNTWQFEKKKIAGCAIDDEVIYRIRIFSPGGSDIGGLNLNIDSLEDMLPTGAEIIDVSVHWTGPNGVTSTGAWIGLTGGPSVLTVSPYPLNYFTYVKVKYPSPTFNLGDNVVNKSRLTFHTPCDANPQIWEDSVTTELCQGISTGVLNKYFAYNVYFFNNPYWFPTFSPNCCGEYRLWYRNTGTIAQGPVIIEDTLSGDVDVNSIQTDIPNDVAILPVTVDVYTWNGTSCNTTPTTTFTYTTVGAKVETTLPSDICRIKWTYDTIPVNTIVREYLDVCVRSTNFKTGVALTPGYIANNPMAVHADTLHLFDEVDTQVDTTAPNVLAVKLFTGECDNGQINPNGPFLPGDTVRYRLAVANVGDLDATLASIADILPTGFTYAGNETYYYGNFNYNINAYNPNCDLFTTTIPTQIGGTITSPSIGDNSLSWTFPVLPARCDGSVEFFLIEFDVALSEDPPVLAGQHENTFDFDASNSPVVTSNIAIMTVNAIAQLQVKKEVRLQGSGASWANVADIPQGQNAEFKLSVINSGNTPLNDLCLLDIAPWVGDINVLPPYNPRNSEFDLPYNPADGVISITPTGFTSTYNTSTVAIQKNPSRASECGGFCSVTDPVGALAGTFGAAATTYSYKVNANASVSLAPGATLEVLVPSTMPLSTAIGDTACNSFAMQAVPAGLPNVCLLAESNNACVVAIEEVVEDTCLIVKGYEIECNGFDAEGNQVYGLNINLFSNVGYTTTISMTSGNANFYNIVPTTLDSDSLTNVIADFTTSASAGDTVCFTIELKDEEQRTVCKLDVCIVIPECEQDTGCECPFEINTKPIEDYQIDGSTFYLSNGIYTSGASLKRIRATIIGAIVTEDCDGVITTYNSGAVFLSASSWLGYTATGVGTPSVTWDSDDCDDLDDFFPNYTLDIPFTSAEKCKLSIKLCIRYEFLDCKCNHCETVLCTDIEVKNPISDIMREEGLNKRSISSNVYPNPITSKLNIDYSLKQSSVINVIVRDLTGKTVATLVNSEQQLAGDYTVSLETSNLSSGVYLYTIETNSESHTNQFVIEK